MWQRPHKQLDSSHDVPRVVVSRLSRALIWDTKHNACQPRAKRHRLLFNTIISIVTMSFVPSILLQANEKVSRLGERLLQLKCACSSLIRHVDIHF
jgi:hypothetical protein